MTEQMVLINSTANLYILVLCKCRGTNSKCYPLTGKHRHRQHRVDVSVHLCQLIYGLCYLPLPAPAIKAPHFHLTLMPLMPFNHATIHHSMSKLLSASFGVASSRPVPITASAKWGEIICFVQRQMRSILELVAEYVVILLLCDQYDYELMAHWGFDLFLGFFCFSHIYTHRTHDGLNSRNTTSAVEMWSFDKKAKPSWRN